MAKASLPPRAKMQTAGAIVLRYMCESDEIDRPGRFRQSGRLDGFDLERPRSKAPSPPG